MNTKILYFVRPTLIGVFILISLSGCTIYSVLPTTLGEVKHYVLSQEQSFSYSLKRVITATVIDLDRLGFTIHRIEHFNQKGMIQASFESTSIDLFMEAITPGLTKTTGKVIRHKGLRDYASEKELFDRVRETLKQRPNMNWKQLTKQMVSIHQSPDETSSVIGYLGEGGKAKVAREKGAWGKIVLMDNCFGYVPMDRLKPVKFFKQKTAAARLLDDSF